MMSRRVNLKRVRSRMMDGGVWLDTASSICSSFGSCSTPSVLSDGYVMRTCMIMWLSWNAV